MNSVVIGNGLLAKAFSKANIKNCLFFCSGVSNSSETREKAFDREEALLRSSLILHNNKCIVYFSSVSAIKVDNPYYNHKKNMERIITENAEDYIIFRVPQVAGAVVNSTLLSFITQNIYFGNSFKVFKHAKRTVVDVEDLVDLFELIYSQSDRNVTLNICPQYTFQPEYLVKLISKKLNTEALYELVDAGSPQVCELDNSKESQIILEFFANKPEYLEKVVDKYVPKIISLL